jgi:dual specificity phosphatase 12
VIDPTKSYSLDSARHISQNPETDITHIVSLCEQADFLDDGCKIQQLVVDIDDAHFTDVLRHLPEILAFMDRAIDGGGAVLVHCYYGISRSATVVAAYSQ